jgi:hypothetical protein
VGELVALDEQLELQIGGLEDRVDHARHSNGCGGDARPAYTPSFEDLFDTGDPELLREPIRDWLAANATNRSATFVLQEWLESGGGPEQALTSCHACVSLALDLGP